MAAALIRTAEGTDLIVYSQAAGGCRGDLGDAFHAAEESVEGRTIYWRATNNKAEHEVLAGFRSKNHADGSLEAGMSVSHSPAYFAMSGYKYLYPVSGRVVGIGSDGEPVLADVVALAKPARKPQVTWLCKSQAESKAPAGLSHSRIDAAACEIRDFGDLRPGETMIFDAGWDCPEQSAAAWKASWAGKTDDERHAIRLAFAAAVKAARGAV